MATLDPALRAAGFGEAEAGRREALFERARSGLRGDPGAVEIALHAPGRIEFLGKHTDYAGGRSLVCATEQGIAFAARPRPEPLLVVIDAVSGESRRIEIDPAVPPRPGDWGNYAITVVRRLARDFPIAWQGADVAFASDLPRAAGVSSSSALVVGLALVLLERAGIRETERFRSAIPDLEHLAGYLGALESGRPFGGFDEYEGVGTMSGSQDQTAILCSRPGALVRYGWDPVRFEGAVPLPAGFEFVIASSGVVAEKTGRALEHYNAIARTTAEIWAVVGHAADGAPTLGAALDRGPESADRFREIIATREVDPERRDRMLRRLQQLDRETRVLIPAAADALARGDLAELGQVVAASQAGAERGLGNQIPETISLARTARQFGAVAASAFGAGFGGAVWALIASTDRDRLLIAWREAYLTEFPQHREVARFVATRAAPPAIRLA